MYEFHRAPSTKHQHGRRRRENDQDFVCWRFADPEIAQAFADAALEISWNATSKSIS
jgi:hypothetical protein